MFPYPMKYPNVKIDELAQTFALTSTRMGEMGEMADVHCLKKRSSGIYIYLFFWMEIEDLNGFS